MKDKSMLKVSPGQLEYILIRLADPETIINWSYAEQKGREMGIYGAGEVLTAETINYRTQKPEPGGLFCERIFGPVKDYECACGKYKGKKYAGVVCEKCGVEVTTSTVRRHRMGYIKLAVPVAHIWFYKIPPSIIGTLLDLTRANVEDVLYYDAYLVLDPGEVPELHKGQVLPESKYRELIEEYGEGSFVAEMGAPAIKKLLAEFSEVNEEGKTKLEVLSIDLKSKLRIERSALIRKKILNKLKIIDAFINSGVKPEWMILDVIPVIPPDLRPLVPLDGGRYASSDLNDLYRRVITRNNRLKDMIRLQAPEVIIRNEKRMLQEAVDALLDNARRKKPVVGRGNRKLKSLSDNLRGKKGLLRRNLLGKRVDYSGRSVIVVGPELKMHQTGIPKEIAAELWRPFIERKLEEKNITDRRDRRAILRKRSPEVWEVLEEVVKHHPVWLNRAPTLHRPSIQAFEPVLVEEKAIKLHPMVCTAYNADFDGDQMAVFLPISPEAQMETYMLMMSPHNILSPAHGKPLATATQDMVIGVNYITKVKKNAHGEGKLFSSIDEAIRAWEAGAVDMHALIKVPISKKGDPLQPSDDYEIVETTVGRLIFNRIIRPEVREKIGFVNEELNKKSIANIVLITHRTVGAWKTAAFLDDLKDLGFKYASISGVTFGIDDLIIPPDKYEIVERAFKEVEKLDRKLKKGQISRAEHYQQILDIWTKASDELKEKLVEVISKDKDGFNPIYMMVFSGARGSIDQMKQLAAMRGLMARPSRKGEIGDLIEIPVISSLKEGLKMMEYFISTHGARKGLSDTALKTASAGYLTRRLVDVAQDVTITMEDCGTYRGRKIRIEREADGTKKDIRKKIIGRIAAQDVIDPVTGEVLVKAGREITEEIADRIQNSNVEEVTVRSVLYCEASFGVCAKCYGRNLATGKLVDIGEAVGIIAAQSIGEPGTQLTLRTFHTGGIAERVTEEADIKAPFDGVVRYDRLQFIDKGDYKLVISKKGQIVIEGNGTVRKYHVPFGARLYVEDGQEVKAGTVLVEWEPYSFPIIATKSGLIRFEDLIPGITLKEEVEGGKVEYIVEVSRPRKLYPKAVVLDPDTGEILEEIPLVHECHLTAEAYEKFQKQLRGEEAFVEAGELIAKVPKATAKTKDITGGLPKVEDIFEARIPSDKAILTEISGVVKILGLEKGVFKVEVVNPDRGLKRRYDIPYGKYLLVNDGEWVESGEPLTDGEIDPHDLLRIKGKEYVQEYIFEKVQGVYELSGVEINDKHIEIIVRQMLRKVRIEDSGNTRLFQGDIVDISTVLKENEIVRREGGKPARYRPVLLGITRAALSTDSFISAASFQETTKVLAFAAIEGKKDNLRGLKENVVIGGIIPAGTGRRDLRNVVLEVEKEQEEVAEEEETA